MEDNPEALCPDAGLSVGVLLSSQDAALERESFTFRSAFIDGQDGCYYTESHGFFYVKPTSGLLWERNTWGFRLGVHVLLGE